MTNYENAVQRVNRGVELLDNEFPGWEKYIDTSRLDIASGYCCVLAQLAENKFKITQEGFSGLCKVLGLESSDDTIRYGFCPQIYASLCTGVLYEEDDKMITALWSEKINERMGLTKGEGTVQCEESEYELELV
jgi:hypothetical protein